MPSVVAVWPNNTISIVRMPSGYDMLDVFDCLDEEDNPLCATCYELRGRESHVTTRWARPDEDQNAKPNSLLIGPMHGSLRPLPWPENILSQWRQRLRRAARASEVSTDLRHLSADEIPQLPAPPPPQHTVAEVRRMDSFCGVYCAYNDDGRCYYVGESEDVTKRVSKARLEIGCRRIGVVKCDRKERKRIEAYFIAMLDPPGNSNSTHFMAAKEEGRPEREPARDAKANSR